MSLVHRKKNDSDERRGNAPPDSIINTTLSEDGIW